MTTIFAFLVKMPFLFSSLAVNGSHDNHKRNFKWWRCIFMAEFTTYVTWWCQNMTCKWYQPITLLIAWPIRKCIERTHVCHGLASHVTILIVELVSMSLKKTYWTSRACWLPSIDREVKNVIWTLISVQFIVSMDNVILAKRVTDRVGGAQSPQRREAPSLDPMSRRTREDARRRMRNSVRVCLYI